MLIRISGKVTAVRESVSRKGQDRVKVQIGETDENVVGLWVPSGTWELDEIVNIKISPDGSRAYRNVKTSDTVVKNPS